MEHLESKEILSVNAMYSMECVYKFVSWQELWK